MLAPEVRVWRIVARFLAVASFGVAALDGYQLLHALPNILATRGSSASGSGRIEHTMAVASAIFCIALIVAGAVSWVRPIVGLMYLARIFAAQIIYELALVFLSWPVLVPAGVAKSFGTAFGAGNVGMYFQILSGLPIWGLVLAGVTTRKIKADALKTTAVYPVAPETHSARRTES